MGALGQERSNTFKTCFYLTMAYWSNDASPHDETAVWQ